MQDLLGESISEIRDLAHTVTPIEIDTGVGHAFDHLMKEAEKLYDIECKLDYDEGFTKIEGRKLATNLYMIVQEAIKNAALDGNAKCVNISARLDDELVLKVTDDGSGMPKEERNKSEGSGMRIMQHRVDLLNGSLEFEDTEDGKYDGTTVTCKVPYGNT